MNHTFTNFIVGPSNRLAHQAALAVAGNPAAAYNPLLIRAGEGSGKTHLLHAIAYHLSQKTTVWQTTYLTPNSLSHKLHNALQNHHIEALRDQYLKTDILLVDDLQDMAGKNYTQQALLHILDNLSNHGKQIVLASTITPQDITSLDQRLQSRLSCGVIVEIQPPELETRLAYPPPEGRRLSYLLVRQRSESHHFQITDKHSRTGEQLGPLGSLCLAARQFHRR